MIGVRPGVQGAHASHAGNANAALNPIAAGNHQTYALDIGFLVEGLLSQAGIMPRGLAHPVIFEVRHDDMSCT